MKESKWKRWLYWASFAVFVIVVYKLLDNFQGVGSWVKELIRVLMPFAMGTLIAYILYFPSKSIERFYKKTKIKLVQKKARILSVITTYAIAIIILVIVVNFIFPILSQSIVDLANNLPNYYKNITEYVEKQPENSMLNQIGAKNIIEKIKKIDFKEILSVENMITYIKGALGVVNVVFSIFVTFIVSIYVLIERNEILDFVKKLVQSLCKTRTYENISKYFSKTNEVFYKYISSQIIDSIIVGVMLSIAMIIMNVKYAVLLGFMIGLFNIIPYFGAIIAVAIALIITVLTGGFNQALWVGIVIIILQQIDANVINPRIVGNSLTLSPLLVIFAVTVGGAYFGVLGMFLSVPAITVLKIVISDYIEYKRKRKEISCKI